MAHMNKVKKRVVIRLFGFLILFFFFSSFVYSAVEVFSNYDTVLTVDTNDNSLVVNKSLSLKNVYDVGIVPGQIEFKIAKGVDGSVADLKVVDVSAIDSFGEEIKTRVSTTDEYSVIVLDVYYPLLPGFEYEFDLNYKLSYKPGGIFFKSLEIPIRESTIPIENGEYKVVLPKNYHFTYLGEKSSDVEVDGNVAIWDIKDDMPNSIEFEYSWMPIRIYDLKGSYVFWVLVNFLLLLLLVFEIRKGVKKAKKRREDG
jgi:hypothetical protein